MKSFLEIKKSGDAFSHDKEFRSSFMSWFGNFFFSCLIFSALFNCDFVYSQCTVSTCSTSGTGSSKSGAGNHTVPNTSTSIVAAGNTWSGNLLDFGNSSSVLCIDGTWTGKLSNLNPGAGTINVNGTVNSGTWGSFTSGGTVTINIKTGASFSITAFNVDAGDFTITNCGTLTITGNSTINGGNVTINNYGTLDLQGTFTNNNTTFTLDNKSGGTIKSSAAGTAVTFNDGTFINTGNSCVTNNFVLNGGALTNASCFRCNNLTINTIGFTNNSIIVVNGNFTNNATGETNNGTINITGSFTNNGTIALGNKSYISSAAWTNNSIINGPGAGTACMRCTGASVNSGIFTTNSARINFYDTGVPAGGFDSEFGSHGSATFNNACTTNTYVNCSGTCSTILPLDLLSFSATCMSKQEVLITWSTASEINNSYFSIERSTDGIEYESIGKVLGAGNSSTTHHYSFVSQSEGSSTFFYYRLSQTDNNGRSEAFPIISLEPCRNKKTDYCLSIDPNPSAGTLAISYCLPKNSDVQISVNDMLGKEVMELINEKQTAGEHQQKINSSELSNGIYFVRMFVNEQQIIQKLVIE